MNPAYIKLDWKVVRPANCRFSSKVVYSDVWSWSCESSGTDNLPFKLLCVNNKPNGRNVNDTPKSIPVIT